MSGQTFLQDPEEIMDAFSLGKGARIAQMQYVNEKNREYAESRWCYDTPGVIQPDQTIHLLTPEELMRTISKKIILPRSFYVDRGTTVFVSGLGRVDYVRGPGKIRINVFASDQLPIMIVETDAAEEIYADSLGTQILGVPMGDEERLACFPKLEKPDDPIIVSAEHPEWISCCGKFELSF